jgi:hypothetical protein
MTLFSSNLLIQKSDPTFIAVSKFCCPVCWHLLTRTSLGGDGCARGRHSTVSPVELPPGLPCNILETMVSEFKGHLKTEIANLKLPDGSFIPGHCRDYSRESTSCYSVKSDKSGSHPEDSESPWPSGL